jgi:hypothetical protein
MIKKKLFRENVPLKVLKMPILKEEKKIALKFFLKPIKI